MSYQDGMWYIGDLRFLLREGGQTRLHEFVTKTIAGDPDCVNPIVVNAHRQLGKSFCGIALGVERCLQEPDKFVKFGAPSDDQVRDIALPNLRTLLRSCPAPLRPHTSANRFYFHNPRWGLSPDRVSTLHIVGLNYMDGDRLRGHSCDLAFLDEVREVPNLRYLIGEVITPQFIKRERPGLVLTTTPPKSNDHEFVEYYVPRAMRDSRYVKISTLENENFTDRDRRMVLSAIGIEGEEETWDETAKIAMRRELLCEFVNDTRMLICPEFQAKKGAIVTKIYPRPRFFFPYTVIDGAYKRDKLAIVFGYVDFQNRVLVIEDSYLGRELTTKEVASVIRRYEHSLWGEYPPHPIRRRGDLVPQQIGDLVRTYKLNIARLENKDPEGALNHFRSLLSTTKVRIVTERDGKAINQDLIHQLENGIWNDRRSDYERTESMGHWDGGQALAYFARIAPWRQNPWIDDPHVWQAGRYDPEVGNPGGPRVSRGMRDIAKALTLPLS